MFQKHNKYSALLIIFFLGILLQYKYINIFPAQAHAWAQSDRYALSLGFVRNDLNFFKPETFVLNHQFPGGWKEPSEESITAVDFPLHDYIPAIFMKITGITSPWIFRTYILLYSFIGLYFLFMLSFLFSRSYARSIFVTLFAATSPVFVFYQAGFLPTIPSLANAIMGIYFYSNYLYNNKNLHFNLCLLFLTLAVLSRTTFAIPLFAILGFEFIRILKKQTVLKSKFLPVSLSISFLLSYFFYNNFLRAEYGSLFLSNLMPPANITEARSLLKLIFEKWGIKYFSQIHYVVFVLLILSSMFFIIFKRVKIEKQLLQFIFLIVIILAGCFVFAFLMLQQFPNHEYYFLDTFFLPIVLLFIILLSFIPIINKRIGKIVFSILLLLACIPMIMNAVHSQSNNYNNYSLDKTAITIHNFSASDHYLDSLGIADSAKILVLDAHAPNIPFILMNRKGFAVMTTKEENIKNALKWNYDYIVFQNEFFLTEIFVPYPDIIKHIKKVADNGRISVCTLSDNVADQTLYKFLGFENKTPLFKASINFDDTTLENSWRNVNATSDFAYSGFSSGILATETEYGLGYRTNNIKKIMEGTSTLLYSGYFLADTLNNCEIVVSITENNINTYFKSYNLKGLLKETDKWERADLLFKLPKVSTANYEFSLFVWNTGKNNLYIDDFSFAIY
ncbi:MAG: glycosyltransferase family 39 protein [Fimbriimonadaceae bacterium]|nr:glycosyltransferase family 39 protein [Chitinophagales bacterium]